MCLNKIRKLKILRNLVHFLFLTQKLLYLNLPFWIKTFTYYFKKGKQTHLYILTTEAKKKKRYMFL
jgi:hypothetical protein